VGQRRPGPARERVGAKLEGGGCGVWPCCFGGGEDPSEAETQEGSDPSQGLTATRWMRAPRAEQSLEGDLAVRTRGNHGPRRETAPAVIGLGRYRWLVKRQEGNDLRKGTRLRGEVQSPEGRIPRALHPERWVGGGMGRKTPRELRTPKAEGAGRGRPGRTGPIPPNALKGTKPQERDRRSRE